MKRAAGFTLIELVIVIVILGILAAVAAPRFLNLQDDAYEANMGSLKNTIQSAMTLANAKAVLEGKDGSSVNDVPGYSGVTFKYGYPQATADEKGILGALQSVPEASDYKLSLTGETPQELLIQPLNRSDNDSKCFVKYTEAADANTPAKVTSDTDCGNS